MLPLVLGGWVASFAVLSSFFYAYQPENVLPEPSWNRLSLVQEESSSMLPLYKPGDFVRLVPMRLDEVQPGRVIAYNWCLTRFYAALGKHVPPILHRVVSVGADKDGWYAITKGDNLPERDVCEVRERDILGIVPLG